MYTYTSIPSKIGGVMGRKTLYLALFVSLACAPSLFADAVQTSSSGTSGFQSNVSDFFTVSGFNGGIVNDGFNGGMTFSQVPFSFTIPGIDATGNTVAAASLSLNSGGSVVGEGISVLSVTPVQASCGFFAGACNFAQSQIAASGGFENTMFTSIQSGAMTANISGAGGNFDLLALGFGPQLLAGDAVTVNGEASLQTSIGVVNSGFNANTQFRIDQSGSFSANGLLTENLVSDTPEPATFPLLATGLLAIGTLSLLKLR